MKSLKQPLAVACAGFCAALAAVPVQAAVQPYAEVGYAWLTLSSDGYDVTTGDLVGRLGYDFTENFGGEFFGATSVASGDLYGVTVKVDDVYGGYLKLHTETAPDFELFAKAGWVHATVKASVPGFAASSSDSSFSYGIGMQYKFTDKMYLQGDYMSYYSKDGDTIKGPSISLGYLF